MCIESLQPPNQTIKQCRQILQGISVGLLFLGMISLVVPGQSDMFTYLLLVFMMYMTWAQFNWVLCSVVFLFMVFQLIMICIYNIYLLEILSSQDSGEHIHNQDSPEQNSQQLIMKVTGIMLVLQVFKTLFFPFCIYYVHYCYKHFKMWSMDSGAGITLPSFTSNNYARFQPGNDQQQPRNMNTFVTHQRSIFGGQGVPIG